MTLKEQFLELAFAKISSEELRDESIKITESFAINFANWYDFMLRQSDNLNSRFTPKELIEMFKKEKRLQ
jgi:hypothetical protein